MKVIDEPQESLELEEANHKLDSRMTLKFNKESLEKDYKKVIMSGISKIMGLNLSDSYSNYNQIYYGVCFIYCISYIYSFADDFLEKNPFIFRASLLLSLAGINTICMISAFTLKLSPSTVSFLYQFFYTSTSLAIILNTDQVVGSIFGIHMNSKFNSILGLLPLIYASKFTIFKDFLKFFIGNLSIIFFYLMISYILKPSSNTFIEALFLLLATLSETLKFYTTEKQARKKFLMMRQLIDPMQHFNKYDSPKTNIEQISKTVKETAEIIKSISGKNLESIISMQQVMDNLGFITRLIGSRSSVYSFNIENLGESIDDEDKVFIKEVCSNPNESPRISSGKIQLAKSSDVLADNETAELVVLLKRIGKEWNFDTFFLTELTKNTPLYSVGQFCMKRFHFDSTFKVPESISSNFFQSLESLYKPNPYHNSSHAADVVCSFLFFVQQSILSETILDFELFSVVLACAAHDVGHPGVTNRFLINSKDELSLLYNDVSVLEMMHCSALFTLARKSESNIFEQVSADQGSNIRSLIIDLILSTDMAKHFDLVGKFKAKIMSLNSVDFSCQESRLEVLKITMKASDVAHAAKTGILHKRWSQLIILEFFNQGELEKQKALPVSMYCDRAKTDVSKSQIGFIKNIVLPIYDCLNASLNCVAVRDFCLNQLEVNIVSWELPNDKKRGKTHFEKPRREKERNELTLKSNGNHQWLE